ncbi:SMI1/KNR4 family protein [Streptomyces sp. NPDC059766]|uniref:SMI1/KNR4 family protein n=1 Tax=Streptomyces sp. NPDC059766 TaxID=3346940 RepID=UPI00366575D4
MSDTFDVAVALSGGALGPLRAWEFVRRFAAEWTGVPLRPGDGFTQSELDDVEAELGFELPAVLRQGYALFGRRDDLTSTQDPLLPATGLYVDDAPGGILVFRLENQGCAAWGIPLDRIEQDDPPVLVESHDGWIPFLDRMSTAWVELVLSESLLAPGTLYDACELPETLLPNLYDRYTRVPLPDHPMWVGPQDSPLRWYSAPGRLIRRDGDLDLCWIHARGRMADDLATLRRDLPASWVY